MVFSLQTNNWRGVTLKLFHNIKQLESTIYDHVCAIIPGSMFADFFIVELFEEWYILRGSHSLKVFHSSKNQSQMRLWTFCAWDIIAERPQDVHTNYYNYPLTVEVWDGPEEPQVWHKLEDTNRLSLQRVLQTIHTAAFEESE